MKSTRPRHLGPIDPIVLGSSLYGLCLGTGLLVLFLVAASVLQGTSFSAFYADLVGGHSSRSEACNVLSTALFLAYVVISVGIALIVRRRTANRMYLRQAAESGYSTGAQPNATADENRASRGSAAEL